VICAGDDNTAKSCMIKAKTLDANVRLFTIECFHCIQYIMLEPLSLENCNGNSACAMLGKLSGPGRA